MASEIEMYEGRPVFWASNSEQLANVVAKYEGDVEPPYVVRIPVKTETVKHKAFSCNHDIGVVLFPEIDVWSIDKEAFSYCENLTSIILHKSLRVIDDSAFIGCSSLSDISIPSSVRWIKRHAFECCNNLTKITIPASVCEIGAEAFGSCEKLTEVTFLGLVEKIDKDCFQECSNLTKIIVPNKKGEVYKEMLPEELHALIMEQSESAVKKTFILEYTKTITSRYFVKAESKEEAESLFWDGEAELEWTDKDDELEITECDEDWDEKGDEDEDRDEDEDWDEDEDEDWDEDEG